MTRLGENRRVQEHTVPASPKDGRTCSSSNATVHTATNNSNEMSARPLGVAVHVDGKHEKPPNPHMDTSTKAITNTRIHTPQQQQQPSLTTSNQHENKTIYVSNLHPRIAEAHLQKLFGAYGEVVRIHLVRKPNTGHMFAFVQYQTIRSAKDAIGKVHGKILLGKDLIVRYAHDRNSDGSVGSSAAGSSTSIKRRTLDGEINRDGDERLLKKQKYDVQSKIESVKRALEESKRKGGSH